MNKGRQASRASEVRHGTYMQHKYTKSAGLHARSLMTRGDQSRWVADGAQVRRLLGSSAPVPLRVRPAPGVSDPERTQVQQVPPPPENPIALSTFVLLDGLLRMPLERITDAVPGTVCPASRTGTDDAQGAEHGTCRCG